MLLKCISNGYTDFTDSCASVVKSTNATVSLSPVLISFIVFEKLNPNEQFLLVSIISVRKSVVWDTYFYFVTGLIEGFLSRLYVSDLWIVNNYLNKHLE